MNEVGSPTERIAIAEVASLRRAIDNTTVPVAGLSVPPECRALAQSCFGAQVRAVYILPNTPLAAYARTPAFCAADVDGALRVVPSGPAGQEMATTWTIYRRGTPLPVVIHNIGADPRWDMLHGLSADTLLRALMDVQERCGGRAPLYSPGHLARRLLDASITNPLWLRPLTSELPRIETLDMAWVRPYAPIHTHLHAFDVNAAYLAVAGDSDFGSGDPMEVADLDPRYVKSYGFYEIKAFAGTSPWNGWALPSPFGRRAPVSRPREEARARGWWAAPHIRCAVEAGWRVEIVRGLVWPDAARHRILRPWADRLWSSRVALANDRFLYPDVEAARAAIAVLKRGYAQAIALFNHRPGGVGEDEPFLAQQARRRLYRPDWRAWIMAECFRRRFETIRRFVQQGCLPVACRTDMLVLACDHAEPDRAAFALKARPEGLGGYRHVWTVGGEAVPRLAELAADPATTAQRFVDDAQREARHD